MTATKVFKFASAIMVAFCMVFTFAACETEEEENGEPSFSDYFTMNITRTERVSDMLVMDWTIKNKSKTDVSSLLLNMGATFSHSTDDLGDTYPYGEYSLSGGNWSGSKTISVLAGETISGSIRIGVGKMSNSAKRFTLQTDASCSELGVGETLEFENLNITDNRVMSKGIQTNDSKLSYTVNSCTRDGDGNVILSFTLKNNTGYLLQDPHINISGSSFTDNLGSFCTGEISLTGSENWRGDSQTSTAIDAGASQTFYLKIHNVNTGASSVSGGFILSSDNYNFECSTAKILTIPIQ